jgi:hypothetical protein
MVYIDSHNAKFGRMIMCHMIADNTDELFKICDKIGVDRKWIQDAGTVYEHFDICLSKKKRAIELGVKEIGYKEIANIISKKKCRL